MDAGVIVGIVGVVVGLAALWAARRYGTRRRRVLFEWTAVPLVPAAERDTESRLTVSYRDIEVPNPYLLTVRLANVGPVDVSSQNFDGGRPVEIELGCPMYGALSKPVGDLDARFEAVGSPGVISLGPGLLARGQEYVVEVIVSGIPAPVLTAPLVDTDVVEPPQLRAQLAASVSLNVVSAALKLVLPGGDAVLSAARSVSSRIPKADQLGNQ